MTTQRMVQDGTATAPPPPTSNGHALDSSRVLLAMMKLSRKAEAGNANVQGNHDSLAGAISKDVLRSLLTGLNFRDVGTVRHARRVAKLAVGLAQNLGWDHLHQKHLEVAALLHDIGKIGVPDNILFKPGKLSPDEAELMALHHNIGIDILQACRVDKSVLEIVIQAHSRYAALVGGDRRLAGNVCQGARILATVDAYDSLSNDQAYRERKSHNDVIKILLDSAGTQFDGSVVSALARWIETEGLPFAPNSEELSGPEVPASLSDADDVFEAASLSQIFAYLYLLESLYDGFYVVDSDMRFVVWNRGAVRMLQHPIDEILGQVWTSRLLGYTDVSGNPLVEQEGPMRKAVATGKPSTQAIQLRRADGKCVKVELQSIPLLDSDGQLHGVAEIFRDLSNKKRRPQEYRELKLAASRDALTSVANRRELEAQLDMMIAEQDDDPRAEPLSVIFLDVDYFKQINDTYGHTAGDQVLVDMARFLQHETYSGELIGRYGGEEFVIVCPGTDLEQATRRAERLRALLPRTEIGRLDDYRLTASFGVAQVEPDDTVEIIFDRADKALYRAKESGRNRTCALTSDDLAEGGTQQRDGQVEMTAPFVFSSSFHACIAADMIVYKLGGFVDDHKAKLTEVGPKRAVVRLGSSGLLPFWGRSEYRQPVELEVAFGDEPYSPARGRRVASKQVKIDVCMRPIGWISDQEAFQARAKRVLDLLRSYFAAS